LIGSRIRSVSSGGEKRLERLAIVSNLPTSRQRTTTQTQRRVTRPQQSVTSKGRAGLLNVKETPVQLVVNRPKPGGIDFDVLKQAKEGVWYRRVVDEEGVSLIRVKNDDVILNADKRRSEDLTLEDKEQSEGFWYRRVDDGDGGVRLVRVRNDDIIIKSLKPFNLKFKTQTTTRTRTSEAA